MIASPGVDVEILTVAQWLVGIWRFQVLRHHHRRARLRLLHHHRYWYPHQSHHCSHDGYVHVCARAYHHHVVGGALAARLHSAPLLKC